MEMKKHCVPVVPICPFDRMLVLSSHRNETNWTKFGELFRSGPQSQQF